MLTMNDMDCSNRTACSREQHQQQLPVDLSSLTFTANQFVTKHDRQVRFQDHYELGKLIGKGGFGSVFLCTHLPTQQQRACKIIPKKKSKKDNKAVLQEFKVLAELDHPNILKVYEMFEDKKYYCIVTELCQGGDLYDWIQAKGILTEQEAAVVIQRLLSAIAYCHEHNLVHHDLKPENVLLQASGDFSTLKLIDFGLARHEKSGKPFFKSIVGSPFYVSPQVIDGHYDRRCDIWAIGTIAYVLLSGRPPFDAPTDQEVLERIQIGWVQFDSAAFDPVTMECTEFLRQLMAYQPEDRPTAVEALQHRWLKTQLLVVKAVSSVRDLILEKDIQCALEALQQFSSRNCKLKQAVAAMIAGRSVRRERTDAVFRRLDRSSRGRLTLRDLQVAFAEYLEIYYSQQELQEQILPHCNFSGTGEILYSELAAIIALTGKNSREHIQAVYQVLDGESKGYLTAQDLQFRLRLPTEAVGRQMVAQVSKQDMIPKKVFEQIMTATKESNKGDAAPTKLPRKKSAPRLGGAAPAPRKRRTPRRSRSMVAGAA